MRGCGGSAVWFGWRGARACVCACACMCAHEHARRVLLPGCARSLACFMRFSSCADAFRQTQAWAPVRMGVHACMHARKGTPAKTPLTAHIPAGFCSSATCPSRLARMTCECAHVSGGGAPWGGRVLLRACVRAHTPVGTGLQLRPARALGSRTRVHPARSGVQARISAAVRARTACPPNAHRCSLCRYDIFGKYGAIRQIRMWVRRDGCAQLHSCPLCHGPPDMPDK